MDKQIVNKVLDAIDDSQKELKEYIRRKLKREEALRTVANNISENEIIDRESVRIVYEGLMDILLSEKTKQRKEAIDTFNVELPPKGKRLSDFYYKNPVGRPQEKAEIRELKREIKKLDENIVYYEVSAALEVLTAKRGKESSRVTMTQAFRKVASDRQRNEPEKTISVMFYEAKKRLK